MHHPTDRIAHTTAFVTPVVEHWLERHTRIMETATNFMFKVGIASILITVAQKHVLLHLLFCD